MKWFSFLVVTIITLSGCATYHLTPQSLTEQFAGVGTEKKEAPLFFYKAVNGNQLSSVRVIDKKGNEKILPVTNHTGVRITRNDDSRVTFYFNTLILQDSTITGSKSNFINAQIKPISFHDIKKIELQK